MIRAHALVVAAWVAVAVASTAAAQNNVEYRTENGIRYQYTTETTQRPISETRYEPREQTVMRERFTTNMQDSVRTYQVPITEQQWVLGYSRTWNIFAPPVPSYRLMPVTRWETRSETVRIPITKRELVAEKQVQHVPVVDTKIAHEQVVRRVAIGMEGSGAAGGTPSVARNNVNDSFGGTRLESNPPVENSLNSAFDRGR
jgi:hypothetical protein